MSVSPFESASAKAYARDAGVSLAPPKNRAAFRFSGADFAFFCLLIYMV
jgi:hypothetical protein